MRRGLIRGRRGALVAASATAVCAGGLLAACGGGGGGDGYVAVGPAGGTPRPAGTAAAPTGDVTLIPLDGAESGSRTPAPGPSAPGNPAARGGPPDGSGRSEGGPSDAPGAPGTDASDSSDASDASGGGTESGRTSGGGGGQPSPPTSGGSTPADGSTAPSGPAKLTVSDPEREPAAARWCEKVTLDFHNTGGAAVRSGTVTFGTHIIGALGIDWATIESAEKLPAPIAAGARKEKTWTVCVDEWRVPLGMHIETQDVSVQWK
ncbi:hypothetical protein [Streptomyces sporangiiformans]|uniref:Secreted protein n=1 Tax=Streptomyces sporangiiformans TaxID=2315329 RepID=A0A505DKW6_9ACTN|nr:hypothetical protein [Streptomyces sporangiiformans]TPQ18851.1 hypothetical protein FGD71_028920 [Streptomyces sporangiiformans]